jgi:predicted secreted protein
MPAGTGTLGRKIIFKWNGATIPGVREKGAAVNGEPVDTSDDDSSGWRELLDEPGSRSVDISLSGVTKSDVLRIVAYSNSKTGAATIEYPDGGIVNGDFHLATYSETGPYNDAQTFEASLQSTGAVTYTPGP